MKKRFVLFLILCLFVFLWGTSCQTQNGDRAIIPVTGKGVVPARIELARDKVLEYITSSSRIPNIPPGNEWKYAEGKTEDEYHFVSGDWLLVVRSENDEEVDQRVVIRNRVEQILWCGYIATDGQVVDTSFTR